MEEKIVKYEFLGEELYKIRKGKGLSQEELADKINVSRQSIHMWESEKSIPDIDNIVKLCNVLEITTDKITNGLEGIKISKKRKISKKAKKILLITVVFLILFYIIISLRKVIILIKLNNIECNYLGLKNYSYIETNITMKDITTNEAFYILEVYYKDNLCKKIYKDTDKKYNIIYEDYESHKSYNFDEINKTVEITENFDVVYPSNMSIPVGIPDLIVLDKELQIFNFIYAFNPFFKIDENEQEYIFYWTNNQNKMTEKISKETSLVTERYILNDNTYTIKKFEIKINETKDSDVIIPDISDYEKLDL